ncbi:MAG: hypothetical protein DRJ03_08075 [Chloroflexi bacterium]|nr:MAG: hypothetical protein DRJ03_08075 [Chloroflexota bacterium]
MEDIKKILDGLKIPKKLKEDFIFQLSCGVSPDKAIRNLVEGISQLQTEMMEKAIKQPEVPADYTETEKTIALMLWENTGVHILDSGDLYGRHWQQNRQIKDFKKQEPLKVVVWDDGEINLYLSVFHFLRAFLARDKKSKALERLFYVFANLPENRTLSWLGCMEEFADKILAQVFEYEIHGVSNTYNWENLLSQGLQFLTFYDENEDMYIILQIHNGCDIRGGYTKPRFFKVLEEDYFFLAMSDVHAYCDCKSLYSDDSGYHWYDDKTGKLTEPTEIWKVVPKKPNAESWEYKLKCEKCGKDVQFYPSLDW